MKKVTLELGNGETITEDWRSNKSQIVFLFKDRFIKALEGRLTFKKTKTEKFDKQSIFGSSNNVRCSFLFSRIL